MQVEQYLIPLIATLAVASAGMFLARFLQKRGKVLSEKVLIWTFFIGLIMLGLLFNLAPLGLTTFAYFVGLTGTFLMTFAQESYFAGRNSRR